MPTNGFGDLTQAQRQAWRRALDQMKTDMGLHTAARDGVKGFSARLRGVMERQEARRDREVLTRPAFEEDQVIDFRRLMRAVS